jgi:hypothetical protein
MFFQDSEIETRFSTNFYRLNLISGERREENEAGERKPVAPD